MKQQRQGYQPTTATATATTSRSSKDINRLNRLPEEEQQKKQKKQKQKKQEQHHQQQQQQQQKLQQQQLQQKQHDFKSKEKTPSAYHCVDKPHLPIRNFRELAKTFLLRTKEQQLEESEVKIKGVGISQPALSVKLFFLKKLLKN